MTENCEFSEYFSEFINDTGIRIRPRGGERTALGDVFVFPDLEILTPDRHTGAGPSGGIVNSSGLAVAAAGGGILIYGPVDSGKTSLLKTLALRLSGSGFHPVYADGKTLRIPRSGDEARFFLRKYEEQYTPGSYERIKAGPAGKRMLLLDNADRIPAGSAELGSFLGGLTDHFGSVLVTAANTPEFKGLPEGLSVFGVPAGFSVYEIKEFGRDLREELISKWIDAGARGSEEDAARTKARLTGAVDTVLGRSLVPSYPVFILTILQMADSEDPSAPGAGSYGQYYEYIITKSLKDVTRREDFPFFQSLLARTAYRMFSRRSRWISEEDIENLAAEVSADFPSPPEDAGSVMTALLESDTLTRRESGFEFRYGYSYHYFAALHFSRNLLDESAREEVRRLCGSLEDEEHANIVLFLTHLSGDPFLLELIARSVVYAASSEEQYAAGEEEAYLDDLVTELQRLIDKDRKLREIRAEYRSSMEERPKHPIGFRTDGPDIRVSRRRERELYDAMRKSRSVSALLRISSEALHGQPPEGPYDIPDGFEENMHLLWSSSLRRKKRDADRMREAASGSKGYGFEGGDEGETLGYLTLLYGFYMRIYMNCVREFSLLTDAGIAGRTDAVPDDLTNICASLFRKDQPPDPGTISRFLTENEKRRFAKALIRECASLRIHLYGGEDEYSREIGKLLGF